MLKAAIDSGADAVYLGGRVFNARMGAKNFTLEEIEEAVIIAHSRDVKIYITLNILLYEEELEEALIYSSKLYELGVDALIIQDLGLGKLLQEQIPDFPLHFSTQGSIYNVGGFKAIQGLGFERVVPARELTLEEIKALSIIGDVEVFVHGALCMCYSGQCQMSRAIGGRSANRGTCGQPCRISYIDDKGDRGHFLSPKDLCLIEDLPQLIEAGVISFKIEGRMKSVEYVGWVTKIYRKYIDKYYEEGSYQVEDEDMRILLKAFNREGFTKGNLYSSIDENFLAKDVPKNTGVKIGTVIKKGKNQLVEIALEGNLNLGDGIEIHSNQRVGNIVTYMKQVSQRVVLVGDIKGKVAKGDSVYRVTEKKQRQAFDYLNKGEMKKKSSVDMVFSAIEGQNPTLYIGDEERGISVEGFTVVERGKHGGVSEERIRKQLMKMGGTPFQGREIAVYIEEGLIMSISEINQMRREGLLRWQEEKQGKRARPQVSYGGKHYSPSYQPIEKNKIFSISSVSKGREDFYIQEHFEKNCFPI